VMAKLCTYIYSCSPRGMTISETVRVPDRSCKWTRKVGIQPRCKQIEAFEARRERSSEVWRREIEKCA
jgi:hypothetical protein